MQIKSKLFFSMSLAALAGCSEKAVESGGSTISSIMASLAITSPSASSSTTRLSTQAEVVDADLLPINEMIDELASELATGTPATMAARVGSFITTESVVDCYGPSWTDTATGSPVNRPSGDLGMVYDTASDTDLRPCAAVKSNQLVQDKGGLANNIINLQATAILAANGTVPVAVNDVVDVLSAMPTITGLTLTAATLTRLADDADGNAVYKTHFEFTEASKDGEIDVYHTPLNAENTEFKGLIKAVLPHTATMGGGGNSRGLSVVYSQVGDVVTYAFDTAANRSVSDTDFFDATTGRVDFAKTAFGEDGHKLTASFNLVTKAGVMHYAWQAGSADGAVRTFAIDVGAETAGAQSGVAYFGFGASIQTITDTTTTAWGTNMRCNWLNGVTSSVSTAKVQAQTFSKTATEDWTVGTSLIDFAPTDSCVKTGSYDVTSFNSQTPTFLLGTLTRTAHELVNPASQGAIPAVTVPTYTLPE